MNDKMLNETSIDEWYEIRYSDNGDNFTLYDYGRNKKEMKNKYKEIKKVHKYVQLNKSYIISTRLDTNLKKNYKEENV